MIEALPNVAGFLPVMGWEFCPLRWEKCPFYSRMGREFCPFYGNFVPFQGNFVPFQTRNPLNLLGLRPPISI